MIVALDVPIILLQYTENTAVTAMRIVFERVKTVAENVFVADEPAVLIARLSGNVPTGSCSVVKVTGSHFDANSSSLTVALEDIMVDSVGESEKCVIIEQEKAVIVSASDPSSANEYENAASGEHAFISQINRIMPERCVNLARSFLEVVEKFGKINLIYNGRKWVNRPHNFLTITPQSTKCNFLITAYGRTEWFSNLKKIDVRPDQNSYVRFWLSDVDQIEEAAHVIKHSALRRSPQ